MKYFIKKIIWILIAGFFATSHCNGQSIIQGNLYDFGSKDSAIGVSIYAVKKTEGDTLSKFCNTISGLDGKFEFKNLTQGLYDLKFEYIYCYTTIIMNVLIEEDTVFLIDIPLFQENTIYEGFIVKEYFSELIKTFKVYPDVHKVEGTFGNKDKRYLKNNHWKSDSVLFKLQPPKSILVNYEELK